MSASLSYLLCVAFHHAAILYLLEVPIVSVQVKVKTQTFEMKTQFYLMQKQREKMVIERERVWLSEMIKSDTCSDCKQAQQYFKKSMRFIVWTFSLTVDSWNENRHLNSAHNAYGMRCSALRPLVTKSACKCYTLPHPRGRTRVTHQAFCQSSVAVNKHKYACTHNAPHQLRWFCASAFLKYSPFCLHFVHCPYSWINQNESELCLGRSANLPKQAKDKNWSGLFW